MRPQTARAGSVWRGGPCPLPLAPAVGRRRAVQQQVSRPLCQRLDRIRVETLVRTNWAGQTEFK